MRAKRAKPGAFPRLEPLENRLAPAATLTPLPDNPDLFTLQIDLSQHPHGGDGLPDTVYVSRAGGAVEVVLVGRDPEVLFHGAADGLAGIELLGSSDVEYVLVADDAGPPLAFAAGPDDVLVQLGQPVPVPPPVEAPGPDDEPAPPPVVRFEEARAAVTILHPDLVFLNVSTASPPGPGAGHPRPAEEEDRPSVPPELLGGAPAEEALDVRRLVGGSHEDARPRPFDGSEVAEQEEPLDGEAPPAQA